MPSRSDERVAAAVLAAARVVLQRVGRAETAERFATALADLTGTPTHSAASVDAPRVPATTTVVDLRSAPAAAFASWDPDRDAIAPEGGSLVCLLDVSTGRRLLREAPHFCSWAGGVAMPAEPLVRPTLDAAEVAEGERILKEALRRDPSLAECVGLDIGVDLASERVFIARSDAPPLAQAREELDEGIVYVENLSRDRVTRP